MAYRNRDELIVDAKRAADNMRDVADALEKAAKDVADKSARRMVDAESRPSGEIYFSTQEIVSAILCPEEQIESEFPPCCDVCENWLTHCACSAK